MKVTQNGGIIINVAKCNYIKVTVKWVLLEGSDKILIFVTCCFSFIESTERILYNEETD